MDRSRIRKTLRLGLALTFAMLLCSCSRIKLVYGYGDWLLERQAHKLLKLNSAPDDQLTADIKAYWAWHRKEMLPAYAALCRKLSKGFRGEEKEEDNVAAATPLINKLWQDTVDPVVRPVAVAMLSLDDKGLKYLEEAFAESNRKERKLYLEDPEAAKKRRIKRTLGYVRDFAGSLSDEQEKKIGELTLALKVPDEAWILDRERRQKEILGLLREKKGLDQVEASLRRWWVGSRTKAEGDPATIKESDLEAFFLGVLRALTPAQRLNAAKVMDAYALDFEELAQGR